MELKQLTNLLHALSQETRLKIFFTLLDSKNALHASAIGALLDVPESTLSHHLSILERVDLVIATKVGKYVLYISNKKTFLELTNFFIQTTNEAIHET